MHLRRLSLVLAPLPLLIYVACGGAGEAPGPSSDATELEAASDAGPGDAVSADAATGDDAFEAGGDVGDAIAFDAGDAGPSCEGDDLGFAPFFETPLLDDGGIGDVPELPFFMNGDSLAAGWPGDVAIWLGSRVTLTSYAVAGKQLSTMLAELQGPDGGVEFPELPAGTCAVGLIEGGTNDFGYSKTPAEVVQTVADIDAILHPRGYVTVYVEPQPPNAINAVEVPELEAILRAQCPMDFCVFMWDRPQAFTSRDHTHASPDKYGNDNKVASRSRIAPTVARAFFTCAQRTP